MTPLICIHLKEQVGTLIKGEKMNIQKYSGYFHDGGIINIKHINNKEIEISMESSPLQPECNLDNIPLSSFKTIRGKLHIVGVKNILANDKLIKEIKIIYDDGEILRFSVNDNKVKLLINWINYPPKQRMHQSELIEIEAEEVYWENIPNLLDPKD